jgi:hypothetical protein
MLNSHDLQAYERMFEVPRMVMKWRGRCDGLPEFREFYQVRQHGKILFEGTKSAAQNFLNQFISGGLSVGQFHMEGAGI